MIKKKIYICLNKKSHEKNIDFNINDSNISVLLSYKGCVKRY